MKIHVEVYLAARALAKHQDSFTPEELRREVERRFGDTRPGVQTHISAHCVANAPKNAPTQPPTTFGGCLAVGCAPSTRTTTGRIPLVAAHGRRPTRRTCREAGRASLFPSCGFTHERRKCMVSKQEQYSKQLKAGDLDGSVIASLLAELDTHLSCEAVPDDFCTAAREGPRSRSGSRDCPCAWRPSLVVGQAWSSRSPAPRRSLPPATSARRDPAKDPNSQRSTCFTASMTTSATRAG